MFKCFKFRRFPTPVQTGLLRTLMVRIIDFQGFKKEIILKKLIFPGMVIFFQGFNSLKEII
jgi:hypothetical protein